MDEEKKQNPATGALKVIWGLIKAYLISVGLAVTFLSIALMVSLMSLRQAATSDRPSQPQELGDAAAIDITVDGALVESLDPRQQLLMKFFKKNRGLSLSALETAVRKAKDDARIKGMFVHINSLQGSGAAFNELRRALAKFRESGRTVHIHLSSASNATYELASVADAITLTPTGQIIVPGPAMFLTYFGDALGRLGVELEVIRTGGYKSALEPFVQDGPSPESLAMYQSIEESRRKHIVEAVAASRNKDVALVRSWFKQSIFTANDAVNAGLIDKATFVSEARETFKSAHQINETVSLHEYLRLAEGLGKDQEAGGDEGLALIRAEGEILLSEVSGRSKELITPMNLIEELKWAQENEDVKGVVFRVTSPGGSATASDMIWNEVKKLAAAKPVVVSMGDVAASGGYYIAAPATKIIAEPSTITGSIGVISGIPSLSGFKEKYGVSFEVVTQSDRANLFNMGTKASAFDRELLRTSIIETYDTFLSRVAEGRKMDKGRVHELGQGKVYTGVQALENGLVDDLGGLKDSFRLAKELSGLKPEKLYPLYQYKRSSFDLSRCLEGPMAFLDCMEELGLDSRTPSLKTTSEKALRWLELLHKERVLTLLPIIPNIEAFYGKGAG